MNAERAPGPIQLRRLPGTVTSFALLVILLGGSGGCAGPEPCPICDAVTEGNTARVRELALAAPPGDRTSALGMLLYPSSWNPETGPAMAAALLDAGADPNGTYPFRTIGRSEAPFLEFAVMTYNAEVVRRLIEKGADVKGRAGAFALLRAAGSKRPDIARLLLDAGADPAFEFKGETPIFVARRAGDAEMEKLLRERGASR